MEYFRLMAEAMMFRAIGKLPDSDFEPFELEELCQEYEKIIADISQITPKELEAFLAINSCRSYDQLAKLIMEREGKNLSTGDYKRLLGRLRTRAHRGREKVIKRIREIYDTED